MTRLEELRQAVINLKGEVEYHGNRRFRERPLGWEALNMVARRACYSAYMALYVAEPNYTRLELAKRELEMVL